MKWKFKYKGHQSCRKPGESGNKESCRNFLKSKLKKVKNHTEKILMHGENM